MKTFIAGHRLDIPDLYHYNKYITKHNYFQGSEWAPIQRWALPAWGYGRKLTRHCL